MTSYCQYDSPGQVNMSYNIYWKDEFIVDVLMFAIELFICQIYPIQKRRFNYVPRNCQNILQHSKVFVSI